MISAQTRIKRKQSLLEGANAIPAKVSKSSSGKIPATQSESQNPLPSKRRPPTFHELIAPTAVVTMPQEIAKPKGAGSSSKKRKPLYAESVRAQR